MYSEIKDYLEQLATYHPDIQHVPANPSFFRSQEEAVNAYAGQTFKLPFMIYVAGIYTIGNEYDAPMRRETHEIWLLDQAQVNDFDARDLVISNMEGIGRKLTARLMSDRENFVDPAVFFNLLATSVEIVGQPNGELHGVSMKLAFDRPHELIYDETQWGDYVP